MPVLMRIPRSGGAAAGAETRPASAFSPAAGRARQHRDDRPQDFSAIRCYRENTPRYGVRVSHSLRQRLNDPIIPAIAKFLQKRHDVFLARLVVAINSGS